ncbi:MAG: class I SAM-dependent methyltransferase [Pseudomonadota bacterium]
MSKYTQANRSGWNGLAQSHFQNYHTERLLAGESLLDPVLVEEVGDVRGKSLIHLLCHIGTDTLSWGLLGANVTGVDISETSLGYARQLADQMKQDARFVESDIMEYLDRAQPDYDIVFSSTGVLCWIPDLRRYADTARALLKEGGIYYLYDGHPFRSVDTQEYGPDASYFREERWEFNNLGDYLDPDLKIPGSTYEWQWTIGDIVTAFASASFRIEFLHEFPGYLYGGYDNPPEYPDVDAPTNSGTVPCSFSLRAVAI